MGTHPIFESDFDCLTDQNSGMKLSSKTRRSTPKPPRTFSPWLAMTFTPSARDVPCARDSLAKSLDSPKNHRSNSSHEWSEVKSTVRSLVPVKSRDRRPRSTSKTRRRQRLAALNDECNTTVDS